MFMTFLIWVVAGTIAGTLTGMVVMGRGLGFLGDLIIGLLGGIGGGLVFRLFGMVPTNWPGQIIGSLVGSIILVALIRPVRRT